MLRGVTTSAEAKAALLQGLAKADYKVMDCIQVLPDVKGLEGKTYGLSMCLWPTCVRLPIFLRK